MDITTVYSALRQKKTAEMVGGITYLSKLMDETIVVSNAKYYAATILDKSKMRQLIAESEKIREAAYSSELPPDDILDGAEQRILEIAQKTQKTRYTDISDVIVENINMVTKHTKPSAKNPQGGLVKKEASIHISNLMLLDSKGVASRIGRHLGENNKLVRYSKKTGEEIR